MFLFYVLSASRNFGDVKAAAVLRPVVELYFQSTPVARRVRAKGRLVFGCDLYGQILCLRRALFGVVDHRQHTIAHRTFVPAG